MTTDHPPAFDIAEHPGESWTLPGRAYTDPEIFEGERRAIHYRAWHYAGSTEQLATPGSYITARILDQTVIIVCGKDQVIRGFFNVCQHRGHELLQGYGHVGLITCPYHAWSYGTDGRFRAGRGTAAMPEAKNGAFDLKPVRVERFAKRFVFFNLDPEAMSLAEQTVGLEEDMRQELPEFDRLAIDAPTTRAELNANWKVLVDNFLECYHCRNAHPAFADMFDMTGYRTLTHPYWISQKAKVGRDDNMAYHVAPEAANRKGLSWWLWPTTTFGALPGSAELTVFNFLPLTPGRSVQTIQHFSLPGSAPDVARDRYGNGLLTEEDISLCESVQRGLGSQGYTAGRFVHDPEGGETTEAGVHHFHRLVAAALNRR